MFCPVPFSPHPPFSTSAVVPTPTPTPTPGRGTSRKLKLNDWWRSPPKRRKPEEVELATPSSVEMLAAQVARETGDEAIEDDELLIQLLTVKMLQ